MARTKQVVRAGATQSAELDARLADDVSGLIAEARAAAAVAVNASLTTLYWRIGQRVREDVLGAERAAYGASVVVALGRTLERKHGRGFGEKNLRRMVQFAEAFPEWEIVVTLSRQLSR